MGYIFVSYSRKDRTVVDQLVDILESTGYDVRIDRDSETIPGGAQWRARIVDAIEGADIFLLVLSSHSVRSDQVRKELDIADEKKLTILPVEIQKTAVPKSMKMQLAGMHIVDLADDWEKGIGSVLDALRQTCKGLAAGLKKLAEKDYEKIRSAAMASFDQVMTEQQRVTDESLKLFRRISDLQSELYAVERVEQGQLEHSKEMLLREIDKLRQKSRILQKENEALSSELAKALSEMEQVSKIGDENLEAANRMIEAANKEWEEIFKSRS